MTQELEPYTGHFPPETVQLALRVLAEAGGNARIAHERLSTEFEQDLERLPSFGTLKYWRDNAYPVRYREIVNDNDTILEAIVKSHLRTSAVQEGEVQAQVLSRLAENVNNLPVDKLAQTASQLSIARGVDIDKLRLLEDKPTVIQETRGAPEILRDIAGRLNLVDTSEDDIQDAQVIEPHQYTDTQQHAQPQGS